VLRVLGPLEVVVLPQNVNSDREPTREPTDPTHGPQNPRHGPLPTPTPPPHQSPPATPDGNPGGNPGDEPDGNPDGDDNNNNNNDDLPDIDTRRPDEVLIDALTAIAENVRNPSETTQRTKVREPDAFDGSDSRKLRPFLIQCELNFRDRPRAFETPTARINYALSYLKGTALEWFEPGILGELPTFRTG
jgi:hypothetical protein